MTVKYLFLWILSFATVTWILIKALRKSYFPPNNDDDGGTPVDINLPIYDPPSGNGLDDLLVDRPPKNLGDTPTRPIPQRMR